MTPDREGLGFFGNAGIGSFTNKVISLALPETALTPDKDKVTPGFVEKIKASFGSDEGKAAGFKCAADLSPADFKKVGTSMLEGVECQEFYINPGLLIDGPHTRALMRKSRTKPGEPIIENERRR